MTSENQKSNTNLNFVQTLLSSAFLVIIFRSESLHYDSMQFNIVVYNY